MTRDPNAQPWLVAHADELDRDGDDVLIAAAATPGATSYTLVTHRLRLLFASRSGTAFKTDTRYRIVVTGDGLAIDLSAPL